MDKNQELLLHLDAAFNLARWLMKNEQDARDVVQDAFMRAFRFKGEVESVKTWFLAIVRNASFSAMRKALPLSFDEDGSDYQNETDGRPSPEHQALQNADLETLRSALLEVSEEQREIFVLREIEELSYQEISDVLEIPIGTTMSRLARARTKVLKSIRKLEETGKQI